MSKVKFNIQLGEDAELPVQAHDTDVGYDVKMTWYALKKDDNTGKPLYIIAHTGVHVQPVDPDYYIEIVPNSRLAKRPFVLGNSVGIIDPGYTGEVMFIFKVLDWATDADIDEYFKAGNVIGQFIVRKRYEAEFSIVQKLGDTERGTGGFGSTVNKIVYPA